MYIKFISLSTHDPFAAVEESVGNGVIFLNSSFMFMENIQLKTSFEIIFVMLELEQDCGPRLRLRPFDYLESLSEPSDWVWFSSYL